MRVIKACFFLLMINLPAFGQVTVQNLNDLLAYADKSNAAARQARLQPYISRQDVNIQASGLYPKVNAFATGDYYPIIATQVIPAEVLGGPKGTYLKAQFGLPYVFTAGVELSMPVVNLEKWSQLAKSRAQYRQAEWSSRLAIENFHLQLIQAYYQYLVVKEVSLINDDNIQTADELMRMMDERKKAGVVNPSDYNRSHNLQLDVYASGVNYEKSILQALNAVRNLVSIDSVALIVADSITSFNWPAPGVGNSIEQRPAMGEAEERLNVAAQAVRESKTGALPRLNLNGRYAYNMQTKLEGNGNKVEFDFSNVNLRLDVPLFQGNYYRSLRKKNELLLESAQLERERVADQLRQQQDDWEIQYRSAYKKHTFLEQKMASAADNLRIAKLSMKEGVMEFDEFNNIFMEYNKTRMDYIQNLADGILYHLLSTQNF